MMGSKNVISVAYASDDPAIRNAVLTSDYIRNETLKRCMAIPSYMGKSLAWKNRYYDVIKRKVMSELQKEV